MAPATQRHCQNDSCNFYHNRLTIYRLLTSFIPLLLVHRCSQTTALEHVSGEDRLGGLDSYRIYWKGPPTDQDQRYIDTDDDNVIHISTKENQKYMCIVPGVSNLSFDTSAKNSSTTGDGTEESKPKSPVQILEPLLTGNFCSYKFEVFWIYELCHGKYLRQYHEENTKYKAKITQEYYLGKMDSDHIKAYDEDYQKQSEERKRTGEPTPTTLINGHHRPYVQFDMTSGTKCDLTKKSRVSRIIYACNDEPGLELYSIKEISTCEYEAIVLAPMLCQHEDFKIDVNTQHEIKCYSLDGSPVRPKNTIDYEDEFVDSDSSFESKRAGKKSASRAYLQAKVQQKFQDMIRININKTWCVLTRCT